MGTVRQDRVRNKLEGRFKGKHVESELYLRDANGNIVRDPVTGKSRRLDFVVHDGENASYAIEVTSKTAGKQGRLRRKREFAPPVASSFEVELTRD